MAYALLRTDHAGVEREYCRANDPRRVLALRDELAGVTDPRHVHYRVLDLDDPEREPLDWDDLEVSA